MMDFGGPGRGPGRRGGRGPGEGGHGGPERRAIENPNAIAISYKNATFSTKNGFLYMSAPKEAEPQRVSLHRNFPYEFLWEYISVLNMDNMELATIRTVDDFAGDEKKMLIRELERKYYSPVIKKIYSVKDRFGFSYWDVETAGGRVTFTLQDTFRSIIRAGEGRLFILDVDGNRFVIENADELDRKSRKKIELFL